MPMATASRSGIALPYGRITPSFSYCRCVRVANENLGVSITTLARNFARIVASERADVASRDQSSLCK